MMTMQYDERSTKGAWIEWIKSDQIVDTRAQAGGKLTYRRQPTVKDLVNFIRTHFHNSGLTDQDIKNAIAMAMSRSRPRQTALKSKPEDTSQKQIPGQETPKLGAPKPPEPPKLGGPSQPPGLGGPAAPPPKPPGIKPKNFDKNKAQDVRFRNLKEAEKGFIYEPGAELSEPVIADAFMLLIDRLNQIEVEKQQAKQKQQQTQTQQKQQADFSKIKNLIDNKLTPEERRYLYKILKPNIPESTVDMDSVKQILQKISREQSNVGGTSKTITYQDLRNQWESARRPTDSLLLRKFLEKQGYDERVILNIFREFNVSGSSRQDQQTKEEILMKISNYIQQNNLKDSVISYLEQEFAQDIQEPMGFRDRAKQMFKKFTSEETKLILETISCFPINRHLIRQVEQERTLGRSMK